MNENRNSGCWLFEIHHLVPFTVLADWIKHCSWWAGTQFSRYHISSLLVSADRPLMDCITLWSLHPHDRCCWPPDLWVVLIPTLLQPFTFPSSSFHTCTVASLSLLTDWSVLTDGGQWSMPGSRGDRGGVRMRGKHSGMRRMCISFLDLSHRSKVESQSRWTLR